MDGRDRRERILQFNVQEHSLAENGYKRVLLQLFGYVGHGKSSFINSCIYTLSDGEYEMKATAGESVHSGTAQRLAYELTGCITIVDNRGCPNMVSGEPVEICAQLGNFLPLNQKVEWKKDFVEIMSAVEDSDLTPNYSDFIVPILVHSVKQEISNSEFLDLKTFFKNCRDMTGIYPIVILTNKLSQPYRHLESNFKDIGAEQVHAIENYTIDDNLKTRGRCNDLQGIIENALMDVKFHLKQQRDPVKERVERKKLLLKLAYEFAVAKETFKLQKHARQTKSS